MRRRAAGLVVLALVGCVSEARAVTSCADAATRVERDLGLPSGLLRSIGQVESGGQPYAVDADGTGSRFASAGDAVAFVRGGAGRFVDVGCFQVDLAWHPDVFRSLDEAFDPVANATAAGRFLLSLRRQSGSWSDAVARYHSADPALGLPYAARVLGVGWRPGSVLPVAWSGGGSDVVVAGVRVVMPSMAWATAGGAKLGGAKRGAGLPLVVTP